MAIQVADNFSYKGGKPLDARSKYATLAAMKAAAEADLYDGCMAYVDAEGKYYTFNSSNTVDADTGKWRKFESGGGAGGHTIEDNGTEMTARASLNFIDFDLTDNSGDDETDVAAHRLTSEEIAEIMSTLPGVPTGLPILFDETGAERVVGWYKNSQGLKKPVYEKDYKVSNVSNGTTTVETGFFTNHSVDEIVSMINCYTSGTYAYNESSTNARVRIEADDIKIYMSDTGLTWKWKITIQYTKTTDQYQ